jgi:pimeloyl-ACP methyl ester carboxylesterase
MTVVRVGDIELDYERSGSGPPLLLLMGMSGTALSWGEPFLSQLRRDFDVIAYDHRGVGASTRLDGPITIREFAADAAGLIEALQLESAHVMGISMGGMVAQELALARPELIETLTVGCTYCGGPESVRINPAVWMRIREARRSGDRALALRTTWEINVSAAFASNQEAWERYCEIAGRRRVAVPVIERQAEAVAMHDTSKRLGEIGLPTLVIHGTEDQLLPVGNGRLIASLIPGAKLEIYENVGHLFFWERAERSAELLRNHAAVHA